MNKLGLRNQWILFVRLEGEIYWQQIAINSQLQGNKFMDRIWDGDLLGLESKILEVVLIEKTYTLLREINLE